MSESLFGDIDFSFRQQQQPKHGINTPLWRGPEVDGVTASLLARFLTCRERFRLLVVEGLKPRDKYNEKMEFGNLWHLCEEYHAKNDDYPLAMQFHKSKLLAQYPYDQAQINLHARMIEELFPRYIEHWRNDPEQIGVKSLHQEEVFDCVYALPSGRKVRLRGKYDSIDAVTAMDRCSIYIRDNKSKSTIDPQKITRQLRYDLQTMFYLVSLQVWSNHPIGGIRYNVIRRPAHKSFDSMLKKLELDFRCGRSKEWFYRWRVPVSASAISIFKLQTLDPVLEQLCSWWDYIATGQHPFGHETGINWRQPYFYNPLNDGGFGELDNYMETGSDEYLQRTTNLFPELEVIQ